VYCSIIGHPLTKPRSVYLWRKFFKNKNLKIKMYPMDITNNAFNEKIKKLKNDPNFLASAITMPYKKRIKSKVLIVDKISKYANAINFILNKNGVLYGFNTDVYGAIESIKKCNKKKIIIFGFGGAGEAIFRVFSKIYKKSTFVIISKKNKPKDIKFKKLEFLKEVMIKDLPDCDLFINCSPLGSNLKKSYLNKSPLSLKQLSLCKKNMTIFDIVYNPKKTLLYKYTKNFDFNFINGIKMNTIQAELALEKIENYYKKNM